MIILVTYKSDGEDVCRGCVVARYSSDFAYKVCDNDEEAILMIAQYHLANLEQETNEPDYEIHLFTEAGEISSGDPRYEDLMAQGLMIGKADYDVRRQKEADDKEFAKLWDAAHKEEAERRVLAELQKKYVRI